MKKCVAVVICAADGGSTPHDNRYVARWNPHTKAGTLELVSTVDINEARHFDYRDLMDEWRTVSRIEPLRPWDGKPNRPLTAITIDVVKIDVEAEAS